MKQSMSIRRPRMKMKITLAMGTHSSIEQTAEETGQVFSYRICFIEFAVSVHQTQQVQKRLRIIL